MLHATRRPIAISLLVLLLGAGALVLTLTSASAANEPPDLHVHEHDESVIEDFGDEGGTTTFEAVIHNDGDKPARNFSIKVSVPSVFPAFIRRVSVAESPDATNVTCSALSNIAWRCDVDFVPQNSGDIGLEIELQSGDVESGFADGAVIVKTEGPANDNPDGERNKHKYPFRVVDLN